MLASMTAIRRRLAASFAGGDAAHQQDTLGLSWSIVRIADTTRPSTGCAQGVSRWCTQVRWGRLLDRRNSTASPHRST